MRYNRGNLYYFLYDITKDGFNNILHNIDTNVLPKMFNDFCLYEIHMFNCMLRRYEGYFINQSLVQMKATITQYLVYSLSKLYGKQTERPQILIYNGLLPQGCASDSFKYQPFSFFNYNKAVTRDAIVQNKSEILFKLFFKDEKVQNIKGCGLDTNTTKLIVFTVINTNDNENIPASKDEVDDIVGLGNTKLKISNNAPNPPYINTNILKSFYNESVYIHKINEFLSLHNQNDLYESMQTEYEKVMKEYAMKYIALNGSVSARILEHEVLWIY